MMGKYKFLDTTEEEDFEQDDAIIEMVPKKLHEWRKRSKHIATKPIPKTEFPKLATLMVEDGLEFAMTDDGYEWYHGEYKVTTTAIREVWGLTSHQWRRFLRWCYKHWPT